MAESAAQTSKHPIVEPDDCDPVEVRRRAPTGALVAELAGRLAGRVAGDDHGDTAARPDRRGRRTILGAAVVTMLLGGGSGAGGSWLFGPGGAADSAALRKSIDENEATGKANAEAITGLRSELKACNDGVLDLEDDQAELEEWTADSLRVVATAIGAGFAKLGVEVDVRLPTMTKRRRRR
jgi:hypothetical protein